MVEEGQDWAWMVNPKGHILGLTKGEGGEFKRLKRPRGSTGDQTGKRGLKSDIKCEVFP